MKKLYLISVGLCSLTFVGCMNMPTQPSQITGVFISDVPYRNLTCEDLSNELNSLARRENQLIIAQEQRVKTSKAQALWYGVGNGDGVEASELANVRGEKEAILRIMQKKECITTQPAIKENAK
jgi:hypothetical protein